MRQLYLLAFLFLFLFGCASSAQLSSEAPVERVDLTAYRIGSHHSLSYASPRWYWRPFNAMIRCQELTIEEQIAAGVTYFDIRIRFKGDRVISGHGLVDYPIDVLAALDTLNEHSPLDDPFLIRIMYESKPCVANPSVDELRSFMAKLKADYPQLVFVECYIRSPFTEVEQDVALPRKILHQYFKDYNAQTFMARLRGLKPPLPKYYAKRNNEQFVQELDSTQVNIFDFVDIDLLK